VQPAAAQLAASSWPRKHHDLRNTGQGTVNGPTTATVKWVYLADAGITTSPTVAVDGTVYVTVGHNPLCALDPDDGSEIWCTEEGSLARESSPTVAADGTIYFGERSNRLWAVNPNSTVKWKFKIFADGDILTTPAVSPNDGTVYTLCGCTTGSGMVFGVDPNPPTEDGVSIWDTQIEGPIKHPDPGVNDVVGPRYGRIYVSTNRAKLVALAPGTGAIIWDTDSLDLGSKQRNRGSAPVVDPDGQTIYIGFQKGVFAFRDNGATVSFLWQYETAGAISSTPALATDGTLYVGDSKGFLYALNKTNGALKWSTDLDTGIFTQPAIGANGTIYVAAKNKAFAVAPGVSPPQRVLWQFDLHGVNKSAAPALGPDGTLYIGVKPRRLYAFQDP
jgi:outer membrane protein assembly factor BamB